MAINYNPETGVFTWPETLNNQWAGKQAGTIVKGYRQIYLNHKLHAAHRLAWYLVTGKWPKQQIDHINGNRDDNRFCNLREASNSENKKNGRARADSSSGIKYVSRRGNKWSVVAGVPQKRIGSFSSLHDAVLCANFHIAWTHGSFARLNPLQGEYGHD